MDSFSNPDAWLQAQSSQRGAASVEPVASSSTHSTYTRTLNFMKDTDFKRDYMNNVNANTVSSGLATCCSLSSISNNHACFASLPRHISIMTVRCPGL